MKYITPRQLKIGIVSESTDNIFAYRAYCRNLLPLPKYQIRTNGFNLNFKTQILPEHINKITQHYEKLHQYYSDIDCILIFTDTDTETHTQKHLKDDLEKEIAKKSFPFPTIVITPNPKIEKWLIADMIAVNKALQLNESRPKHNKDPKMVLSRYIGKSVFKSTEKFKMFERLAKLTNIEELKKSIPEFRKFEQEFTHLITKTTMTTPVETTLKTIKKYRHISGKGHGHKLPKDLRI